MPKRTPIEALEDRDKIMTHGRPSLTGGNMKLVYLKNKEEEIINKIRNHGGEITDGIEKSLEITKAEIIKSIDSYAYTLKHGLKEEKQYWKNKKAEVTEALNRIEKNEDFLKQQLHSIATEMELKGEQFTISPDTSVTRKVTDYDKVDEEIGEYTVRMTPESFLRHFKDKPDDYITVTRKVLLKDLPEGHEAIEELTTPTIKITKTK